MSDDLVERYSDDLFERYAARILNEAFPSRGGGDMSESMGQAQGVPAPQSVETTPAPQVAVSLPEPVPTGPQPGETGGAPLVYGAQPAEAPPVHDVAPPVRADFRPAVVDVPYAYQEGSTLNCTMGNWNGEPFGYNYQWQVDGVTVGSGPSYPLAAGDVGRTFACVVTATNAGGSTDVTSNTVVAA